jgi:hypothetical protein
MYSLYMYIALEIAHIETCPMTQWNKTHTGFQTVADYTYQWRQNAHFSL